MRTKIALVSGAMILVLLVLIAQPVQVVRRLRDLTDVKHAVPPSNGQVLTYNSASGTWTNATAAGSGGTVGLADFNTTQFGTNGGTVSVKSGATVTNLSDIGTFLATGNVTFSQNPLVSGVWIDTGAGAGLGGWSTNLPVGDLAGGVGASSATFWRGDGTWAPASGSATNTYNTIITTNLTVLNSLTVSNISVTNITVQNNLTVSNLYTVNGNHNTMIITNYVQMPWTTLTMSGTNVSAVNLAAGTMFKLTLTNNAYFGVPSGLPGTNLAQTIQIHLLQDGTGGRTVTMTNASWLVAGSGASTNAVVAVTTNANSVTILTFATSPFSSTLLYGVPTAFVP